MAGRSATTLSEARHDEIKMKDAKREERIRKEKSAEQTEQKGLKKSREKLKAQNK